MRSGLVGRGVQAGLRVGALAAAALWGSVVVLTAGVPRDTSGFLTVLALAVGPAVLVVATVVGGLLALLAASAGALLRRTGPVRAVSVVGFAVVASCCWGAVAAVVPTAYLLLLPGDGTATDTATVVVTVVGAVGGTVASLSALRGPRHPVSAAAVRMLVATTFVGAAAGLLGWWLRRGGPSWSSGLPSPMVFSGSGFDAGPVDLTGDWVWGVTTGAVLGVVVAVLGSWTRWRPALVVLATIAGGAAADVSAVTGVVFPEIDLSALVSPFPSSATFATAMHTLPGPAIALTVVVWAVGGGLLGAVVAVILTPPGGRAAGRERSTQPSV